LGSAKPHTATAANVASVPVTVPPPPVAAEPAKAEAPKPSPFEAETNEVAASKKEPESKKETAAVAHPIDSHVAIAAPSKAVVRNDTPLTLITPRAGEIYLQLAALVPHTVLRYLDELHAQDLEPCVAPGPTPELLRVLVGPFPDKESLAKAKAKLDAEKMAWIVRAY